MSVLSACQSAAIRLRGDTITSLYGATDPFSIELADLVNETARDIASKTDWQALTKLNTFTGTGAALSFPLPADFDRMLSGAEIHAKSWQTGRYVRADDLNQWLDFIDTGVVGMPGAWTIISGQMYFQPVMPTTETARFYYISKNYTAGGKAKFDNDADTFLLPEHLLTLGLMWRWREMKRFEYDGDLENYSVALSEAIARDRGPRIVKTGYRGGTADVRTAYPGPLG